MPSFAFSVDPGPRRYRFFRGLIRIWFVLIFRRIRVLHAEVLPDFGAAMLVTSHPASFLDALILAAAFERPMHCLVDRSLLPGPLRGLFAWGLSMIPYEPEGEGWRSALRACCDALARRAVVVAFAEHPLMNGGDPPRLALTAATIALEAESRHSGQLGLTIFPLHLFSPVAPSQSSEVLIHVDAALFPQEFSRGGDLPGRALALATALDRVCRENPFRLESRVFEQFLADLEEVLRSALEENWSSRPNWGQKVEGLKLSQFVAELADRLNHHRPERLAALCEFLDAYRQAHRRCSLAQLEVDAAGGWLKSPARRMWVWIESAAGLPVACYGLINHFLIGLVFFWSGLFEWPNQTAQWLPRALVMLGWYAIQIFSCSKWLGRSAAGVYALSLPFSGAYLWRYRWLLRYRTRLLLMSVRIHLQAAHLKGMRKDLLGELNAARDAYAEALGVPH